MAEGEATRDPLYVEAQRNLVKLIDSRFTGWIVAGILLGWLTSAILQQLGYGTTPESVGRIAELAFMTYVVRRASQANGNGAK